MSDTLFQKQINKFLSKEVNEHGDGNEIIAIKGAWGAGKTHAWNYYLKQARDADKQAKEPEEQVETTEEIKPLHLKKYAYVSLYGMNSIEDLRRAIFESVIDVKLIGDKTSWDTKLTNTWPHLCSIGRRWGRRLSSLLGFTPFSGVSLDELAKSITARGINKTAICIDDLERRGKALKLAEIFGLANHLRESRSCRVAIIFNDEKLSLDENYFSLIEKTIDREITFSPSPQKSCEIAFENVAAPLNELLTKICVDFGFSNIRILKKTAQNAKSLLDHIGASAPVRAILKKLLSTIALQTHCYYNAGQEAIPNWGVFKDFEFDAANARNSSEDSHESKSNKFLSSRKYSRTGPMESALAHLVETGVCPDNFHAILRNYVSTHSANELAAQATLKLGSLHHHIHATNEFGRSVIEEIITDAKETLSIQNIGHLMYTALKLKLVNDITPYLRQWIEKNPTKSLYKSFVPSNFLDDFREYPEFIKLLESTKENGPSFDKNICFDDAISKILDDDLSEYFDHVLVLCATGTSTQFKEAIAHACNNRDRAAVFDRLLNIDKRFENIAASKEIALKSSEAILSLIDSYPINEVLSGLVKTFQDDFDRLAKLRHQ